MDSYLLGWLAFPLEKLSDVGKTALDSRRPQNPRLLLGKSLAFVSHRSTSQRRSRAAGPGGWPACRSPFASEEVLLERVGHSSWVSSALWVWGSLRHPHPPQRCLSAHLLQKKYIKKMKPRFNCTVTLNHH